MTNYINKEEILTSIDHAKGLVKLPPTSVLKDFDIDFSETVSAMLEINGALKDMDTDKDRIKNLLVYVIKLLVVYKYHNTLVK